jgi:bis(5'-nucleosidyl)-tetraphosphatase
VLEEKSCGAVIFLKQNNQTKYLLLNYSTNHWDYVKGGVEPNETEKETVIRELREETGITDAKFIDGFRELIDYHYRRQGLNVHKIVILYLMEAFSEDVKLSFEHKAYIWLDYEQAMKKLSFSNEKEILSRANAFLVRKGMA